MTTRVLIAGGGVAAIEAMLALHALAEDRVEIELLGAEPHFWCRPLSVAELLQTLAAGDPSWNQPALKQELAFLQKTPTRGSGSVAFVAATADEKWFPAGY